MEPEPELVDETVGEQVPRELAAADEDEVALPLRLQPCDSLGRVSFDQTRVPLERLAKRPRGK
jgi:hypothetical protein